jgi:hypothetical protein
VRRAMDFLNGTRNVRCRGMQTVRREVAIALDVTELGRSLGVISPLSPSEFRIRRRKHSPRNGSVLESLSYSDVTYGSRPERLR